MKKAILLLAIFIGTIACGNSEKSASEKRESSAAKDMDISPCELLTETEIKNALAIPAEAETSMTEKNTTYPSCYYKWKSITWEYEVMAGHMADYPAEMSIVLITDANKRKYESAINYYKDGQTENGLGDMATWSDKKNQITFLSKGKLVHVHARTSSDAASNKTKTIKVAKLIAEEL